MKRDSEVREIILYGDGELKEYLVGWTFDLGDKILFCDASESGAWVAGGYMSSGKKAKVRKLVDVLAENPFARIVAPGTDYIAVIVNRNGIKSAVELLNRIVKKQLSFLELVMEK